MKVGSCRAGNVAATVECLLLLSKCWCSFVVLVVAIWDFLKQRARLERE